MIEALGHHTNEHTDEKDKEGGKQKLTGIVHNLGNFLCPEREDASPFLPLVAINGVVKHG